MKTQLLSPQAGHLIGSKPFIYEPEAAGPVPGALKTRKFTSFGVLATVLADMLSHANAGLSEELRIVLERMGATLALEPYAPNIIRVSMSSVREPAAALPGYGFIAAPTAEGWTHRQENAGDIYQSSRLVATVASGLRSSLLFPPRVPVDSSAAPPRPSAFKSARLRARCCSRWAGQSRY